MLHYAPQTLIRLIWLSRIVLDRNQLQTHQETLENHQRCKLKIYLTTTIRQINRRHHRLKFFIKQDRFGRTTNLKTIFWERQVSQTDLKAAQPQRRRHVSFLCFLHSTRISAKSIAAICLPRWDGSSIYKKITNIETLRALHNSKISLRQRFYGEDQNQIFENSPINAFTKNTSHHRVPIVKPRYPKRLEIF